MYNENSPVIQNMRAQGMNNPYNIFTPDPPLDNFMNPPQPPSPNQAYYDAVNHGQLNTQLNMPTTLYQPVYANPYTPGQPQPTPNYQQQRQPWQLLQPRPTNGGPINPFVQNSPNYSNGYYSPYNQQRQQQQMSYVIPGWNPTGRTEMYSPDMRERLNALDDKYQKLNTEKAIERRNMYSGYGYNYYGMMNQNYIDPVLKSQYNREKAEIEAEARDLLMDFNMRLSRAAHYYLGDLDMDDEETVEQMKKVYTNEVVTMNEEDNNNYFFQRSLDRGYDVTEAIKASMIAADRKVSEYYHNIVSPKADLDEFLQTGGMILWQASVDEMNRKGATFNERYSYQKLQNELQRNLDIRDGTGFYPSRTDLDPSKPFAEMARLGILDPSPGVNMDFNTGTISLDRNSWEANKAQIQHNREQMNYEAQRRAFIDSVYNPVI